MNTYPPGRPRGHRPKSHRFSRGSRIIPICREDYPDALQDPLPIMPDLVDQPVPFVVVEECVAAKHMGRLAMRLEQEQRDLELVEPQMQDRIVELASVSRNFETMQRALSMLSNDIDQRAITELGRRQ